VVDTSSSLDLSPVTISCECKDDLNISAAVGTFSLKDTEERIVWSSLNDGLFATIINSLPIKEVNVIKKRVKVATSGKG
jgi:hypothetical protein